MQPFEPGDGAKAIQQRLILDALRVAPLSTIEARERLGVMHSSGRVMELRRAGHRIETVSTTRHDEHGRPHRCATYVLRGVE